MFTLKQSRGVIGLKKFQTCGKFFVSWGLCVYGFS